MVEHGSYLHLYYNPFLATGCCAKRVAIASLIHSVAAQMPALENASRLSTMFSMVSIPVAIIMAIRENLKRNDKYI